MATVEVLDAVRQGVGDARPPRRAVRGHGQRAADAPGGGRRRSPRIRAGTHPRRPAARSRGGGRSRGARRAPAGPARARSARRSGSGGGVAHGPQPRDHDDARQQEDEQGALRSALTDALQSGKLAVVDELGFDEPKTKAAVELLDALELDGQGPAGARRSRRDGASSSPSATCRSVRHRLRGRAWASTTSSRPTGSLFTAEALDARRRRPDACAATAEPRRGGGGMKSPATSSSARSSPRSPTRASSGTPTRSSSTRARTRPRSRRRSRRSGTSG